MTSRLKKLPGICLAAAAGLILAPTVFADAGTKQTSKDYLMWQMPTSNISFPIYVYSGGNQVGYLYGPAQQAFAGSYDPTRTTASYQLYYQDSGAWHGCTIALLNGAVDNSSTTCTGTVINNPASPTSNVYTIGPGAIAWPSVATAPAAPTATDYGKRKITFINDTKYSMIQIGEICTVSANPHNPNCANNQNLFQIAQGDSHEFLVDNAKAEGAHFPAGLNSYGFTVTAYQDAAGNIVKTGGYNSGSPYATKIESTSLPVIANNGAPIPQGATNFDVSAVDGYNISVIAYPESATYCTYTVPPENSNILGAGYYSKDHPLGRLLTSSALCKKSSQLPPGKRKGAWNLTVSTAGGDFQGCMSPCTYATKKFGASSQQAQRFCCSGAYNTAASCDKPAGVPGANNSSYVTNLKPPVSTNVYRFAYDDAIGDFACPAETNFVIRFVSNQSL